MKNNKKINDSFVKRSYFFKFLSIWTKEDGKTEGGQGTIGAFDWHLLSPLKLLTFRCKRKVCFPRRARTELSFPWRQSSFEFFWLHLLNSLLCDTNRTKLIGTIGHFVKTSWSLGRVSRHNGAWDCYWGQIRCEVLFSSVSCRKNMDKSKFSLTVSILFPTWQTRRRELRLGLEPKAPRQSPCGLHATKRFLRSPKRFEKTAWPAKQWGATTTTAI